MVGHRNPLTQSFDGAGQSDDLEFWGAPLSPLVDEVMLIVLNQSLWLQDHLSYPSVQQSGIFHSALWLDPNWPVSSWIRTTFSHHPGSFTVSSFRLGMFPGFSFLKAPAPLPTQFQFVWVKKSNLQHTGPNIFSIARLDPVITKLQNTVILWPFNILQPVTMQCVTSISEVYIRMCFFPTWDLRCPATSI